MYDKCDAFCLFSQVGHVTCDNASNNRTMLQELASRIKAATGIKYNWQQKKIKYVERSAMLISCIISVIDVL